jgi:hypothetical protein
VAGEVRKSRRINASDVKATPWKSLNEFHKRCPDDFLNIALQGFNEENVATILRRAIYWNL